VAAAGASTPTASDGGWPDQDTDWGNEYGLMYDPLKG
jgi:hypothetical protein